jgi:hypothetical protein
MKGQKEEDEAKAERVRNLKLSREKSRIGRFFFIIILSKHTYMLSAYLQ